MKTQGNVIDLFSNRSSHKRHFRNIQEILAARVVNDRLYLELYVDKPTPPDPYYVTLTCTVEDPPRGGPTAVKIEAVTARDGGHHVMVRSEPLGWAPEGARTLSPSAMVRLASDDGRMLQNMLLPLLEAHP